MAEETAEGPARRALACGVVGLALWLVSYSWIFVPAPNAPILVLALPFLGEVGAVLAAIAGIVLGARARRSSWPASSAHRTSARALALNGLVIALVIVPNVLGLLILSGTAP